MSDTTTSLDIQSGKGDILDIAKIFPMTEVRTLDLARHGTVLDYIQNSEGEELYGKIDLAEDITLHIERFSTLDMLDIALPEIVNPVFLERGIRGTRARPRYINLVSPLKIPYGSLDIRREQTIPKNNTYPDLFTRSLPYGIFIRRLVKHIFLFSLHYQRRVLLTLLGFFIFSVPVLSYVFYAVSHGYSTLEHLTETRELASLRTMVSQARGDFERSNFLFTPFSWIPVDRVDMVRRAISGGLALTRSLDILSRTLPDSANSSGAIVKKDTQDPLSYRNAPRDIFLMESLGISNPTDWIGEHQNNLEQVQSELFLAGNIYTGVVPTGERTLRMQKIGKTLTKIASILDWSLRNQKDILNMLGDTNPQRYIVFNQNRDEVRANGGFPGSIISFTLYKGNILDYHGDDVYYYDWNLYPYKEIPPPGIALLTDSYGLRDVNYYPDFHETLEKANSFIERSGDATVTTGIAIHQGIVEDILTKIGPVTVSGVSIPFDGYNFSLLMSILVENKYAKENSPKDILFRFASAFAGKLIANNSPLELIDTMKKSLEDGEILFASRDPDIDTFLNTYKKKLPWELSQPNWIYPIWTSVSGNKSDRYITRTYQSKTKKINNCIYENTITLETKHTFEKTDSDKIASYFKEFGITDSEERTKLNFIQGNGKNRAFVRVYVPLGSSLVGSGSDITTSKDNNATIFSTLIETPVGAMTSKSWKYTLDIPNCVNYDGKVEWTRQPGLREVIVK